MTEPLRLSANYGDAKPLKWDLGRDLSDVTEIRVLIAKDATSTPVVDEVVLPLGDPVDGIIQYTLDPVADFAENKLEPGEWLVKVRTEPGPLTHPDDEDTPHNILVVLPMMAVAGP